MNSRLFRLASGSHPSLLAELPLPLLILLLGASKQVTAPSPNIWASCVVSGEHLALRRSCVRNVIATYALGAVHKLENTFLAKFGNHLLFLLGMCAARYLNLNFHMLSELNSHV